VACERENPMRVEVLAFEGCPHAGAAISLVKRVVENLAPEASVEVIDVDSPEKAAELGFLGSPSIRVNGQDIEQRGSSRGDLCCRTYAGEGVPPEWMVEAAILRALEPVGILFLCVGNSARSQMAEGIARSIAPAQVRIASAGSRPTFVRPEAIAVLQEIGVDISGYRSKAVSEISPAGIDTVITLCGEEECPIFSGHVRRLHWGLADPAAYHGKEGDRLEEFRHTRDELRRRIQALFIGGKPAKGAC
jgi:arsenate reductase (thioredoxin)